MKWMTRLGLFLLAIVTATVLSNSTLAQSPPPTVATFADWCAQQQQLTPEARHTVDVLLEKAGTKECDRANKILTNLTSLDLGFNKISDLSPLAPLTNLTQLDLSYNQISDLSPLASLTTIGRA